MAKADFKSVDEYIASQPEAVGTIHFPLSQPVPVRLIGRIAKFHAQEVAKREKAKAAPKKC